MKGEKLCAEISNKTHKKGIRGNVMIVENRCRKRKNQSFTLKHHMIVLIVAGLLKQEAN